MKFEITLHKIGPQKAPRERPSIPLQHFHTLLSLADAYNAAGSPGKALTVLKKAEELVMGANDEMHVAIVSDLHRRGA